MARYVLAFTLLSDARAITRKATPMQRARSAPDGPAHRVATRIEAAFEKHGAVDRRPARPPLPSREKSPPR